jgi:predicted dehydrogenase
MVRIAVIGAGAWGANHVRVVASEPTCELALVVDRDANVCAAFDTLAPTARDHECALSSHAIDAVVIATPAPTHVELAIAALAAGKHVLVEKPCALTLSGARRIVAAAAQHRRIAMVGHLMVFHPGVVQLRDAVASGELGQVQHIQAVRGNVGRIRSEESALWGLGPHELSMLEFILEQTPVRVSASGRCIHHPGVEDTVNLTLHYPRGERADVVLSRVHPHKQRVLSVVGSRGERTFEDAPPPVEPLRLQLQHFTDSIATGATPVTDISSGLRITQVLDAAQQSLSRGGVAVSVEQVNVHASYGIC